LTPTTSPFGAGTIALATGAGPAFCAGRAARFDHLAINGHRFDGTVFRAEHGMPDAIDGELLADCQFQACGGGAKVNEVAVVENNAIYFAMPGEVEGLHRPLFMNELAVFGAGQFQLPALFGGERGQLIDRVIWHSHFGECRDLDLTADSGLLDDQRRQGRGQVDLDGLFGGLDHEGVDIPARAEVVADDGAGQLDGFAPRWGRFPRWAVTTWTRAASEAGRALLWAAGWAIRAGAGALLSAGGVRTQGQGRGEGSPYQPGLTTDQSCVHVVLRKSAVAIELLCGLEG
jgi:hypothetical protein